MPNLMLCKKYLTTFKSDVTHAKQCIWTQGYIALTLESEVIVANLVTHHEKLALDESRRFSRCVMVI